jgi:CheY-like chemotaxis protein
VELPLTDENITETEIDQVKPSSSTKGASILITDDDVLILKLMSVFLKKEGYRVDTATDGRSCLKKIDENAYDVLITDMIMDDIKGDKLIEHLEERDKKILKKVILCTGDVLEQEDSRCYEAKGIRILYKPFELSELRDMIEDVLNPV